MEKRMRELTGDIIPIGFEKAKIEKVVSWFLRQAMKKRNHYLVLRSVPWVTDKIERIITRLQPRYKAGVIYHKRGMGKLEQQLIQFPEGVHDDLPDAAQMVSYLLNNGRTVKQQKPEDSTFDKLMKFTKESKKPRFNSFRVGSIGKGFRIPSSVCPI
jgi:phage terminase large subunit-like protein